MGELFVAAKIPTLVAERGVKSAKCTSKVGLTSEAG